MLHIPQTNQPRQCLYCLIMSVRPLLEYATQVWSPHDISLVNSLETVLRGFTQHIHGFWNLSYAERLYRRQLPSLEQCRLLPDLVYVQILSTEQPKSKLQEVIRN